MTNQDLALPLIADGEDKSSPFKNRLRKNYRHLRKWAKRTITNCFRLYDRDIKEYPVAIDFYAGHFFVQFFADHREMESPKIELQTEVMQALQDIFAVPEEQIHWRLRGRRKMTEQYEKLANEYRFLEVLEYGVKFKVNLHDYLDTGLFLDHRETRRYVASLAKGKKLLNLFAYTCSFSVHAALAGAQTTSVDLSNTYLAWGQENFELNQIDLHDQYFVRADCLKFVDEAIYHREKYDLIVIDPPTMSRSKKMDDLFDVQQDHVDLITQALKLLNEGGIIFFSTNSKRFRLDPLPLPAIEISEKMRPLDFQHRSHRCWKIQKLPIFK